MAPNGAPTPNAEWDGTHVQVAVIDTGWPRDLRPDGQGVAADTWGVRRSARETSDPGDEPDLDGNDRIDPVAGHGTFIARLISQYAPGVAVDVVRALTGEGDGAESDIITSIGGLIDRPDHLRPQILNLSFGTYAPEKPLALQEAIQAAQALGIIVVASAGNDGTSRLHYPAAYPDVVSVGALGPDGPAPFSNWGEWVRASAPGVDVPSEFWTFPAEDTERFEGWALWSGTSFAAPIVAAALASELQQRELQQRATGLQAVERVIDDPHLYRHRCYGTVVNPPRRVQWS